MLNPKSNSPGLSTENYSRDFLVNLDKKLDKFFEATKDNNELKQRKVKINIILKTIRTAYN